MEYGGIVPPDERAWTVQALEEGDTEVIFLGPGGCTYVVGLWELDGTDLAGEIRRVLAILERKIPRGAL